MFYWELLVLFHNLRNTCSSFIFEWKIIYWSFSSACSQPLNQKLIFEIPIKGSWPPVSSRYWFSSLIEIPNMKSNICFIELSIEILRIELRSNKVWNSINGWNPTILNNNLLILSNIYFNSLSAIIEIASIFISFKITSISRKSFSPYH